MSWSDPLRTLGVGRTILAIGGEVKMIKGWPILFTMLTVSACASSSPPLINEHAQTAVIFGTVDQSEWCPAGNVRIDLETGQYALTKGASRDVCQNDDLERPVAVGRLGTDRVRTLKRAFQRTTMDGLDGCRGGSQLRTDDIIVSNGGLHVLVVTDGRHTDAAPTDLSCWSAAAWILHDLLDDTFRTPQ